MADQFGIALTAQDLTGPAWQSLMASTRAAQQQISGLKQPVDTLAGAVGELRTAFEAVIASEIVGRMRELNNQVIQSAAAIATQADAIDRSTDQLQALQAAARDVGVSFDTMQTMLGHFNSQIGEAAQGNKVVLDTLDRLGVKILDGSGKLRDQTAILREAAIALMNDANISTRAADARTLFGRAGATATPIIREFARSIDDLTNAARQSGQILDSQTVAALKRMQDDTETAKKRLEVLWAQFATPIDLRWLNVAIAALERIQKFRDTSTVNQLQVPIENLAELRKQLAEQQKLLDQGKSNGGVWAALGFESVDPVKNIAALNKQIAQTAPLAEAAQKQLDEFWRRKTSDMIGPPPETAEPPGIRNPPAKSTGRDRIGEEMRQLQGNVDAARTAYDELRKAAASAVSLEDLQRQVDLQKKIADELARIGKYAKDDPRVPQIKALVTEHENYETQIKKLEAALKTADTTEKQFGDGAAELKRRQAELNDALDTGRLSYAAYSAAMTAATLAQQEQALKAKQFATGIEGISAGFQYAALQSQRANSAFAQGGALFQGTMNLMDQALNEFTQNGQINFDKLLASFLSMIAQMELRAAASEIFGLIQGGLGGGPSGTSGFGLGSIGGKADNGVGGGFLSGIFSFFGGLFADGGRPPVGVPSIVGEKGPELFVPDSAGTVYPNGSGPASGGGSTIVVQQTVMVGSVVSQAQHEADLRRVHDSAMAGAKAGLLEDIKSGGNTRRIVRG